MDWRAPDKPREAYIQMLAPLDHGNYVIQSKLDGYACVISFDGKTITAKSRHNISLPVHQSILDEFKELNIPTPWMLNGEWMKLRAGLTEQFYLFDVMYIDDKWQGQKDYIDRWNWLVDNIKTSSLIQLVRTGYHDFVKFMEQCIDDPLTEGVVIKHKKSKLIGSLKDSKINPQWIKVKHRAGVGGDTVLITKQQLADLCIK